MSLFDGFCHKFFGNEFKSQKMIQMNDNPFMNRLCTIQLEMKRSRWIMFTNGRTLFFYNTVYHKSLINIDLYETILQFSFFQWAPKPWIRTCDREACIFKISATIERKIGRAQKVGSVRAVCNQNENKMLTGLAPLIDWRGSEKKERNLCAVTHNNCRRLNWIANWRLEFGAEEKFVSIPRQIDFHIGSSAFRWIQSSDSRRKYRCLFIQKMPHWFTLLIAFIFKITSESNYNSVVNNGACAYRAKMWAFRNIRRSGLMAVIKQFERNVPSIENRAFRTQNWSNRFCSLDDETVIKVATAF